MDAPTYLPLLNSIAVNEAKGQCLLNAWADSTRDAQLAAVLRFVAIREGEHAMAFEKRMCELGFAVDQASAYQFFKKFDEQLAFLRSGASDAEKVACFRGDASRADAGRTGTEQKDPFRNFLADTTMDPLTGALMGRYVCEERDSGRRLKAEYDRVCGAAPRNAEIEELRACVEALQAEVSKLKSLRSVA